MKEVREEIIDLTYELEGPIDGIIQQLQHFKETYKDTYSELRIERDRDYDGDLEYNLLGLRPETEKERKQRIKKQKADDKRIQEREQKLLQDLKKKYEWQ